MLYEILQWTALALAVSLAAASIWILANHIGWARGFRDGIELGQEDSNGYQQQDSAEYQRGYQQGRRDEARHHQASSQIQGAIQQYYK